MIFYKDDFLWSNSTKESATYIYDENWSKVAVFSDKFNGDGVIGLSVADSSYFSLTIWGVKSVSGFIN
jgi:hypothetical protein